MSAQGGAMPREVFIQNNLGLAHACAGRFKNRGMEYDELYAAACLGLVKAYDGFDWSRGVCFSTYAVPVILGEIKKLFRNGGTVKVSRSIKELGLKINARREQCLKQTGCEPTVVELAQALNTTPEQIARAADMKLIFSVQPAYAYLWGGKGGMYERRVGERYLRSNNFAAMFAAGAVVCGGSDSDVTEPRPMLGIHAAVNRAVPQCAVSVEQAIEMYTVNGAYALFEDKRKGKLAPGYLADIVVLDRDIRTVPAEQLEQTDVTVTIKSGSVLHSRQ